jgi:hypothetical protein
MQRGYLGPGQGAEMKLYMAIVLILGVVTILPANTSVEGAESAFREGNNLFQQGDYDGAILIYEDIITGGYLSGSLYYNLGNAYYRTGDVARAILNYERARRKIPDDEDLRYNIGMARMATVDQIEPIPRLFVWDYWDSIKSSFSLSSLILIGFFAYLAVLASIAVFVLARNPGARRYSLPAGFCSFALLLLVLVLLTVRISSLENRDQGVIMVEIADVKNAPDEDGPDAFVLHPGTLVKITDRVGDWMQVRLEDGKVGWTMAENMEII